MVSLNGQGHRDGVFVLHHIRHLHGTMGFAHQSVDMGRSIFGFGAARIRALRLRCHDTRVPIRLRAIGRDHIPSVRTRDGPGNVAIAMEREHDFASGRHTAVDGHLGTQRAMFRSVRTHDREARRTGRGTMLAQHHGRKGTIRHRHPDGHRRTGLHNKRTHRTTVHIHGHGTAHRRRTRTSREHVVRTLCHDRQREQNGYEDQQRRSVHTYP